MSRGKGNRIVRERAIPFYSEHLGLLVAKVEFVSRYSEAQDLFVDALDGDYTDTGFDLICLSENRTFLVQVKTNSPPTQKWYRHFAKEYAGNRLHIQAFTWYDREGIRIQHYQPNGKIIETELRKSRNDATRVIWFDGLDGIEHGFPDF